MLDASRILQLGSVVHALVALLCVALLQLDLPPILGVHPALKPLKFGISIALFLGTMAFLVPSLALSEKTKKVVAALLVLTMLAEMMPIGVQAARGRLSHFNTNTPLDAWIWNVMIFAIVVMTVVMVFVACTASWKGFSLSDGMPFDPLQALAWQAGLWIFLLAAVSGFKMGGGLQHSIGGIDGGAGLPFLGWSVTHGDLRAPHFIAMHALQALPMLAEVLRRSPLPDAGRFGFLVLGIVAFIGLAVVSLMRSLAGLPVLNAL